MSGCQPQFTKKYLSRSSPNFPANKCRGQTLTGQDGTHMYLSKKDSRGIYRWVKLPPANLDFLNEKRPYRKASKKSSRKASKKSSRKVSKKSSRKVSKKSSRKVSKKSSRKVSKKSSRKVSKKSSRKVSKKSSRKVSKKSSRKVSRSRK